MNLSNAIHYQFIADDGSLLSNLNAFEQLQRDGANLATAKWVDNHYSLILWKIAGMIQAQPDLFDDVWHWKTVILQLKYRSVRSNGSYAPMTERQVRAGVWLRTAANRASDPGTRLVTSGPNGTLHLPHLATSPPRRRVRQAVTDSTGTGVDRWMVPHQR